MRGHVDATASVDRNAVKGTAQRPVPKPAPEPVEQPDEELEEQPEQAPVHSDGRVRADGKSRAEARRARLAPPKKKKQHGLAYRWVVNVAPIFVAFFVLLGGVWVYTEYVKPPSPEKQWQTIEAKWAPAREKASADIAAAAAANPFDLAAYQAAAKSYAAQIQGWSDATTKVSDWGKAANDMPTFQQYATQLVSTLKSVETVTNVYDLVALQSQLQSDDQTFESAVLLVDQDLGQPSPVVRPSPIALPSVSPTPTPVPSASGSPGASSSPAASSSAVPSPTPTPAPSASAS